MYDIPAQARTRQAFRVANPGSHAYVLIDLIPSLLFLIDETNAQCPVPNRCVWRSKGAGEEMKRFVEKVKVWQRYYCEVGEVGHECPGERRELTPFSVMLPFVFCVRRGDDLPRC